MLLCFHAFIHSFMCLFCFDYPECVCRTLNIPVTDIVRTGDKTTIPQEGLKKAANQKVRDVFQTSLTVANGRSF